MFTHEQIKPYLLHADRRLRRFAIDYLADSFCPDPELLPMFLRTFEQFPDPYGYSSWEGMDKAARFTVGREAIGLIIERLGRIGGDDESTEELRDELWTFFRGAPVPLLSAHEAALRELGRLEDSFFARLERRRSLAGLSGEELWQQLRAFSESCADVLDIDWSRSDDLVEALAPHGVPDQESL